MQERFKRDIKIVLLICFIAVVSCFNLLRDIPRIMVSAPKHFLRGKD